VVGYTQGREVVKNPSKLCYIINKQPIWFKINLVGATVVCIFCWPIKNILSPNTVSPLAMSHGSMGNTLDHLVGIAGGMGSTLCAVVNPLKTWLLMRRRIFYFFFETTKLTVG
jgi:hypothetical protein